jgi:hypothetical protein
MIRAGTVLRLTHLRKSFPRVLCFSTPMLVATILVVGFRRWELSLAIYGAELLVVGLFLLCFTVYQAMKHPISDESLLAMAQAQLHREGAEAGRTMSAKDILRLANERLASGEWANNHRR